MSAFIIFVIVIVVIIVTRKESDKKLSVNSSGSNYKHEINNCRNCSGGLEVGQKYCSSCGFEPLNGLKYCQQCGAETKQGQGICTNCGFKLLGRSDNETVNTEHDAGMFLLGLLIPIAGIIIYIIFNESQPGKANSAIKGALWGLIILAILLMLMN